MGFINKQKELINIYERLYDCFGPRHWWPAETQLEMVLGAILVQNVSWKNTLIALENIKNNNLLNIEALHCVEDEVLANLIRSTRYYRMKAKKVKAFTKHLLEYYQGDLQVFLQKPLPALREELLSIYGIGEETADSIILYGSKQPIFVVDSYTRRIFHRLGYFPENIQYQDMQKFFMNNLPRDVQLFNEYHALIDCLGNRLCSNKNPLCEKCPLKSAPCSYQRHST